MFDLPVGLFFTVLFSSLQLIVISKVRNQIKYLFKHVVSFGK